LLNFINFHPPHQNRLKIEQMSSINFSKSGSQK
jgi:hypothetical protein